MFQVEAVVIGAGVVGLAIARRLAADGREVLILEEGARIGEGISSRNSEVLHAGLYYEPGSLKARLCVAGRRQLTAYCDQHRIPYHRCGKLIVGTDVDCQPALERIHRRATAAGVDSLQWLDRAALSRLEPAVRGCEALLSPDTGIIDSHALMFSLLGGAEDCGAQLALRSKFDSARLAADGFRLSVRSGAELTELHSRVLINCAGLDAVSVAHAVDGLDVATIPQSWLAKGHYFTLSGRCPFSHLIYPVPSEAGLGVHLTLDLAGQARFGPDVQWVDRRDYCVDPALAATFEAEIRQYWPSLPGNALQPAYAGIRPKIVGPDSPAADFLVIGPREHGLPGLVNLFGIESPGLTASLAIADYVASVLAESD